MANTVMGELSKEYYRKEQKKKYNYYKVNAKFLAKFNSARIEFNSVGQSSK